MDLSSTDIGLSLLKLKETRWYINAQASICSDCSRRPVVENATIQRKVYLDLNRPGTEGEVVFQQARG